MMRFSHTSKIMMGAIMGICLFLLLMGLFFIHFIYPFEQSLPFAVGMTVGCFQSLIKVVLLEKSIDHTLDMEKTYASQVARLHALGRFLMTAAFLGLAVIFPAVFGLFGTIIGIMSMQLAAFVTNIILSKTEKQMV